MTLPPGLELMPRRACRKGRCRTSGISIYTSLASRAYKRRSLAVRRTAAYADLVRTILRQGVDEYRTRRLRRARSGPEIGRVAQKLSWGVPHRTLCPRAVRWPSLTSWPSSSSAATGSVHRRTSALRCSTTSTTSAIGTGNHCSYPVHPRPVAMQCIESNRGTRFHSCDGSAR